MPKSIRDSNRKQAGVVSKISFRSLQIKEFKHIKGLTGKSQEKEKNDDRNYRFNHVTSNYQTVRAGSVSYNTLMQLS